MNQTQKNWITSKTIYELSDSFASLLKQERVHKSDWIEWVKVWSEANPVTQRQHAWSVFKDS